MPLAKTPIDTRWPRWKAATLRAFRAYADWLVSISWKRFWLLALLLMIGSNVLKDLPPFDWTLSERTATSAEPAAKLGTGRHKITVTVDTDAGSAAASSSGPAASGPAAVHITVPPGADSEAVKEAVAEARDAIAEAMAENGGEGSAAAPAKGHTRIVRATLGDYLTQLALLFVLTSVVIKITYRGRVQAEVQAAKATETAEAESLKRQVLEARVAAMQAQVEPHFLFNTLASIDHLIQTDPPRASVMQKHLIALLRASMPGLRETPAGGVRDLRAELAVITPYLDILKVRMEERLRTVIDVPEGLRSAEFPPMVLQSLVENAIRHGLEPKPEGGLLTVHAEIVHGQLAVSVADTGLGFGQAQTAGTGTGLANIRERLQLLYGGRAALTVAANPPGGTVVTVTVPYAARTEAAQ